MNDLLQMSPENYESAKGTLWNGRTLTEGATPPIVLLQMPTYTCRIRKASKNEGRPSPMYKSDGRRVGCRLEIWPLNRVIMLATAKERH